MLIYRNDGKLFSISKKALQIAGYHDIEHFNAEHNDFSELFVKRPGYIYDFENFSWLSFLRNAHDEQKRVLIETKDNAVYECELSLDRLYPVEFDEETPEFFYQIEFKNLKLTSGTAQPLEDFEELTPQQLQSEEKLLEASRKSNMDIEPQSLTETAVPVTAKESIEESRTIEFGFDIETKSDETQANKSDDPLDLVDFEFGIAASGSEEPKEPMFIPEETSGGMEVPEIGLKAEPEKPAATKNESPVFEKPAESEDIAADFLVGDISGVSTAPDSAESGMQMPDIAKISSALGLPETMVKEFIKEFIATYMNDLPEVEAAMASSNTHVVKKEAIKLKGVAANLMMEPLSEALENVVNAKSDTDIASAWKQIERYINGLLPHYAPEFAPGAEEEKIDNETGTSADQEPYIEPLFEKESGDEIRIAEDERPRLKLEEKDTGETIVFDPNEAADALGLPESLILEFVNDFISQAREEMSSFEDAYEKGDIETINEIAHKLKGVAANLRIEDMRQLMENVQHAKSPQEVEKELIDFYHKLAALTKTMAKEYA